jgi:hypothetical protein
MGRVCEKTVRNRSMTEKRPLPVPGNIPIAPLCFAGWIHLRNLSFWCRRWGEVQMPPIREDCCLGEHYSVDTEDMASGVSDIQIDEPPLWAVWLLPRWLVRV